MEPKEVLRLALTTLSPKLFNFKSLSKDPNLPFDVINDLRDEDWNWTYLSENPSLTLEDVISLGITGWNWDILSGKFSLEEILKHPKLPWNYKVVGMKRELSGTPIAFKFGNSEVIVKYNILEEMILAHESYDTDSDSY